MGGRVPYIEREGKRQNEPQLHSALSHHTPNLGVEGAVTHISGSRSTRPPWNFHLLAIRDSRSSLLARASCRRSARFV
eukprot:16438930-Heterocapsa_arctica.AAC.1